jgi:hypothetical protein
MNILYIYFLFFFLINLGIFFMKRQMPCTFFSSSLKSSVTDFGYSFLLFSDKISITVAVWSSYSLQSQKIYFFKIKRDIVTCWVVQATNMTGSSSDDWIY